MTTCLVNLCHLDPPNNGGLSRLAREVSVGLLEHLPASTRVVFAVRARFLPQFRRWLNVSRSVAVVPYTRAVPVSFLLRWVRPDVIVSPLFGVEPLTQTGRIPHLVSLPDTLVFDHPELFDAAARHDRQQVYQRARSAAQIITLSDFSRDRLLRYLSLSANQVQAIALGADGLPAEARTPAMAGPYVYYPANSWPHKRHALLLQAMRLIWQSRPDLKLVLSGGRPPQVDLAALIAQMAPAGAVLDLGYVSEAEVSELYTHAEALLFTSQYEGFGMPLLEAMRAGCPVICAPVSSMPEVAGDAALYVDNDAPEAWAEALLEHLPQQRADLVRRGYERAAAFTWAQTRQRWATVVMDALQTSGADD